MKPFPKLMLFSVYRFTKVLSANSDVFVSDMTFYRTTITPLQPFEFTFSMLKSVSLLMLVV